MFSLPILIVAFLVSTPAGAGPITNGGFETGNFDGWNVSGVMVYYGVSPHPHSGVYSAWFGDETGLTYIAQNVATVAGHTYRLSF